MATGDGRASCGGGQCLPRHAWAALEPAASRAVTAPAGTCAERRAAAARAAASRRVSGGGSGGGDDGGQDGGGEGGVLGGVGLGGGLGGGRQCGLLGYRSQLIAAAHAAHASTAHSRHISVMVSAL